MYRELLMGFPCRSVVCVRSVREPPFSLTDNDRCPSGGSPSPFQPCAVQWSSNGESDSSIETVVSFNSVPHSAQVLTMRTSPLRLPSESICTEDVRLRLGIEGHEFVAIGTAHYCFPNRCSHAGHNVCVA